MARDLQMIMTALVFTSMAAHRPWHTIHFWCTITLPLNPPCSFLDITYCWNQINLISFDLSSKRSLTTTKNGQTWFFFKMFFDEWVKKMLIHLFLNHHFCDMLDRHIRCDGCDVWFEYETVCKQPLRRYKRTVQRHLLRVEHNEQRTG